MIQPDATLGTGLLCVGVIHHDGRYRDQTVAVFDFEFFAQQLFITPHAGPADPHFGRNLLPAFATLKQTQYLPLFQSQVWQANPVLALS
jgi:hypothetical protein